MAIWRYYLKMLRYEQFFVPIAMMGICIMLILMMRAVPNPAGDASPSIAIGFMEAALPFATALVATGVFLNDPVLELHYTVPRPLWRTQLEKLGLLTGIMTVFYLLFSVLTQMMGVPLLGWAASPIAVLIWLIPAVAWVGITSFVGAVLHNSVAANALAALIWLACFMLHDLMTSTTAWRMIYPFMTIFEADSSDWITNRAVLLLIGGVSLAIGLIMLRNGEGYFKQDA